MVDVGSENEIGREIVVEQHASQFLHTLRTDVVWVHEDDVPMAELKHTGALREAPSKTLSQEPLFHSHRDCKPCATDHLARPLQLSDVEDNMTEQETMARVDTLMRFLNGTAKSGSINVKPILKEIARLLNLPDGTVLAD